MITEFRNEGKIQDIPPAYDINTTYFTNHRYVSHQPRGRGKRYRVETEAEGAMFSPHMNIVRVIRKRFEPRYPSRAHLNIFISKEITKMLIDVI